MQEAKISIVGRLTTGIAHELNNPLATITANAELALDTLENLKGKIPGSDLEEFKESLKIIEEQAFRCTRTIKALLDVIMRAKPPTSKGIYLRSITLSSTMGVGVKIDPLYLRNVMK